MKPDRSIWIIEDDSSCQFVYEEILGLRYQLKLFECMESFETAIANVRIDKPNLIIADIRLPGGSFLNFFSSAHAKSIVGVPFLVVSSVDDLDALRTCFDNGAADYITKPFGKAELVVKIEKIFLSQDEDEEEIQIDPSTLTISVGDRYSGSLTSKEFQIVALLVGSEGHRLAREEIISKVWGNISVSNKTLDVHLFKLRKKISSLGLGIHHLPPNSYQLLDERVNR